MLFHVCALRLNLQCKVLETFKCFCTNCKYLSEAFWEIKRAIGFKWMLFFFFLVKSPSILGFTQKLAKFILGQTVVILGQRSLALPPPSPVIRVSLWGKRLTDMVASPPQWAVGNPGFDSHGTGLIPEWTISPKFGSLRPSLETHISPVLIHSDN